MDARKRAFDKDLPVIKHFMSFSNLSRRLSRTQKLSTGSLVNGEDASVTTAIELQNHQGKAFNTNKVELNLRSFKY